jgi:hypothetical protein
LGAHPSCHGCPHSTPVLPSDAYGVVLLTSLFKETGDDVYLRDAEQVRIASRETCGAH